MGGRAHTRQNCLNRSRSAMNIEAHHNEAFDHSLDLFLARFFLHGNNHGYFPVSPGLALRCQLILLQRAHHIDDAFVNVGQLDIRQRTMVGGANILEDHALAVGFIHRHRGGTL